MASVAREVADVVLEDDNRWLIPDLHTQPLLITRRNTGQPPALPLPDTQRRAHENIRIQDIIGCDLGAWVAAEGVREGRPDALEERGRGLLQHTHALLPPSQGLFAILHRVARKGSKGQLRMRLIYPVLERRGHDAIHF